VKRVVFIISLATLGMAQAYACQCYPSYSTKTYQEIRDTWYGKKVSYSCLYECRSGNITEQIEGFHIVKVIGSEKGNEIVCDGTVYKEVYSPASGWFGWVYKDSEWFDPKKSKSKDLKSWAKFNCQ
jgi:hypothetical protein